MTKMKLCPVKLSGIQRMTVAVNLKGNWRKQKGERDTGKVGRIYQAMNADCPTVEVVDTRQCFLECINQTKGFVGLDEMLNHLTENGYQIIRKVEG